MTPFHYALMIDNIYIMTALLKNKPDLLVKDCNGESAISLATSKQREIINKYIKL